MTIKTLFAATGILVLLPIGSVDAGWEWTFPYSGNTCGQGQSCANTIKNERSYSGTSTSSEAAPDVTATAWSNPQSSPYGEGLLGQRYLASYGGGLGVVNSSGDGDHEVDNQGWIDSVLLSFDAAVTLSDITFGWVEGDSDFTLAAYRGDGTDGGTDLTQWEYDQLVTHGWEVIGSYFAAGSSTQPDVASGADPVSFDVNPGGKSSSYWLVSALNPRLDDGLGSFANTFKDKFKLKSAAASAATTPTPPHQIPEPGVLSMLLLGLVGAVWLRRRRTRWAPQRGKPAD